jgi:DNA-binding protein YbaB
MSEAVLDLDSGAEDSSPDTGSSSEQPTNEVELFADDTPTSARDNGDGNSNGETSDFDPEQHDWLRGDTEAVPEQYRGLVPLAKNLQAQFTRTQQDLAEQRRELQAQQGEWANRVQQVAVPQQPQIDPIQEMRNNLSDEDARGIDAVEQIIQHRVGTQMQQMQNQVAQLQNQLSHANQYVQGQQTAYIDSQVQEARGEYGQDLDNYTDQIVATVRINNPQTGQPYTVREAYELHAGITAQKAAELRQNDSQARKSSKRAVRSSSGVDASEETGPMSDNEVLSGLANLGFD